MTAVNPFQAPGRWFRGNTHSHSTESDGRLSIPDRFAAYRDAGYDFLVLTDHRKVSDVSAESRPDFLAISGSEVHPDNPYGGDRYHFVAINIHEPIRDTELHPNEAIAAVRAQGGEVVVCHPYWCGHTINDLQPLEGYFAVEVFNATCMGIGKGFSESHWDELLDKVGSTFGIAADDAHGTDLDVFQGWISVKARELSINAILEALRTGAYYSTQGPEIIDLQVVETAGSATGAQPGRKVVVRTSPVRSIIFKSQRSRGLRALPSGGELLTEAEFPLTGSERYVRVEITGPDGKKAWSNPLFF
jgi:hypothetical protein